MQDDDLQLANELDAALDATKGAPTSEYVNELQQAARAFSNAVEQQAAEHSFKQMLRQLPAKQNNYFSFFTSMATKFMAGRLATIGSAALAVVLVVYGVGSLVKMSLLVPATSFNSDSSVSGNYGEVNAVMHTGLTSEGSVEKAIGVMEDAASMIFNPDKPVPPIYPYPPDYGYGQPPASDTREYLQLEYHTTLRTREVQELSQRVQTIIRGYDGRIDNANTAERFAYISFVVPKDKFEVFKQELTDLVPAKFMLESISSQNLLGEKRTIEASTEATSSTLSKLEAERAELDTRHTNTLRNLNNTIARLNKAIAVLDTEASATADPVRQAQIKNERVENVRARNSAQAQLNRENIEYERQRASYNNQINYTKEQLKNLAKQDVRLIDKVETVRGTVRLEWISLRGILSLYIAPEWQAIILGLAIIGYLWHRRRQNLAAEPVQ